MATKSIVTGGAGFIGSHLVDALIERGDDVHVIDDLSGGKRELVHEKATFHEETICDREAIAPIFEGADYVFHTAALPRVQFSIEHPIETHEANVTGTLNVLKACVDGGVKRVVFSSSSSIYGDQSTMPLVEDMDPGPKSPYGLHKYMGELYCKMWNEIYGLPSVCLRYFNVYGPRQSAEGAYALVIAKFLKQREEGGSLTITGDGKQTRDFTHVTDVVQANLKAASSDSVGSADVINVGAGNNVSINKIAELIGGEVEHIEARYEPHDTLADNTRARELLGWAPSVTIEEGIAELKKLHGLS
ncbi:MAG: NAD-dependent epimerase/dehydratase family protein [Candidatus Paceibacterota bacterium]